MRVVGRRKSSHIKQKINKGKYVHINRYLTKVRSKESKSKIQESENTHAENEETIKRGGCELNNYQQIRHNA